MKNALGFASSLKNKHNLDIRLYWLGVIFQTLTSFCVHFFPVISKVRADSPTDLKNLYIGGLDCNSDNHFKQLLWEIPCVTMMLILYIRMQIIKKRIKTNSGQFNIVTFNQNFYFYCTFTSANIVLFLTRLNNWKYESEQNVRNILVSSYLMKIFTDWFVRPTVILILLRNKNISNFFEDFDCKSHYNSFEMIGVIAVPREQKFLDPRPFCQNARWGSSKKFQAFKADNIGKNNQKFMHNTLTDISVR